MIEYAENGCRKMLYFGRVIIKNNNKTSFIISSVKWNIQSLCDYIYILIECNLAT